jgi:hypothetical protein
MVCKWLVPGDAVEGVDYDLKVCVRVYACVCVCGEMVAVHGNTTLEHTRTQIHLHAH